MSCTVCMGMLYLYIGNCHHVSYFQITYLTSLLSSGDWGFVYTLWLITSYWAADKTGAAIQQVSNMRSCHCCKENSDCLAVLRCRQLKKFNMPQKVMVEFYTAIIESILTSSITIWFAASTAKDKGRLQRIIRSPEKVIGCDPPALLDLFHSRTSKRAGKITADPSHPGHHLFQRLPSTKRFRAIRTETSRHLNSFFPMEVGLTNKPPASH